MRDSLQDWRYAIRQMKNNPALSLIAIVTLGLGIGANSAMFSFTNALMLRSLPVRSPDRLVHLVRRPGGGFDQKSFEYLRDHNHTLAGLVAWDDGNVTLTVDGDTRMVPIDFMSGNSYDLLGVSAFRGRMLSGDDELPGKPAVAVLSYFYWRDKFGADPSVIGRQVQLKNLSCTIVGIAPPWFRGLRTGGAAVPLTVPAKLHQSLALKDNNTFDLYGRLPEGLSRTQAAADVALVYKQFAQSQAASVVDPAVRKDLLESRVELTPARQGSLAFNRYFLTELGILEAVVGLVLLIACVNIANLLLARGAARRKEIGIRLALGASHRRIARQLFTEHLLLGIFGGVLGLWFCVYLSRLFWFVLRGRLDVSVVGIEIDKVVVLFTALLSIVTAVIFGLWPAIHASRSRVSSLLKLDDMHSRARPIQRSWLVAPQIAISLAVLVLAGLLLRSLQRLYAVDLGFDHQHLLTFWIYPTLSGYDAEGELRLYDRALTRLNAIPGVRAASLSRHSLLHRGRARGLVVDGAPQEQAAFVVGAVAPRFFETLRVPLLLGRDFTARDSLGSEQVVIVNESAARKFFRGINPLGHRIANQRGEPGVERKVVGIVKDMKFSFRDDMPSEAIYMPYAQSPSDWRGQAMVKVNVTGDPEGIKNVILREVKDAVPQLPITELTTEDNVLAQENVQERSLTQMLAGFGVLGLGLALLGLYGTVSYSVSRRNRELAIRVALGAQPGHVLFMIIRESMSVVGLGAVLGALLAAVASRTLESFLFDVPALDPVTYVVLITALIAIATIAVYVPARRATGVDPQVALRCE